MWKNSTPCCRAPRPTSRIRRPPHGAASWRYTFEVPPDGWTAPGFDDAAWETGHAPFGRLGGEYGRTIQTKWRDDNLWLRQDFDYSGDPFELATLIIFHDDGTELFLNGEPLWSKENWVVRYDSFDLTEAVRAALRPGANTLAARVRQDEGGQFFDLALLLGRKTD